MATPPPCIYEGAFVKPVAADFMRRVRARPRRHRLRSVESQARRSGNDFEPRFRALPQSRKLREVPLSRQVPLFSCVLWPTRLKTRPNIYSGSSRGFRSADVTMRKITENAALHPNEDPCAIARAYGPFSMVVGVVLQVASGPAAGLTPVPPSQSVANILGFVWLARLAPRCPPSNDGRQGTHLLLRPAWPPGRRERPWPPSQSPFWTLPHASCSRASARGPLSPSVPRG